MSTTKILGIENMFFLREEKDSNRAAYCLFIFHLIKTIQLDFNSADLHLFNGEYCHTGKK